MPAMRMTSKKHFIGEKSTTSRYDTEGKLKLSSPTSDPVFPPLLRQLTRRKKPFVRHSFAEITKVGVTSSFPEMSLGQASIIWIPFLLNWHLLSFFRSTP